MKHAAGVRFSNEVAVQERIIPDGNNSLHHRKKRPRLDHQDDDDDEDADYGPGGSSTHEGESDSEDPNAIIPTQKSVMEAKRERRLKQYSAEEGDQTSEDATKIDDRTSLAAEGVSIEPFHMKNEKSDGTGYFDGDTYVFRQKLDDDEEPDAWLDDLDDSKTNLTSSIAVRPAKQRESALDDMAESDLFGMMVPLMSDGETVLQAISRYGAIIKRNSGKESNRAKESLDKLTQASSVHMLQGRVDIYQMKKEDIVQFLPKAHSDPALDKNVTWEYQGNQDNAIHGPFTTQQMLGWIQSGYFVGEASVKVRWIRKAEGGGEEKPENIGDDLMSDLLDDEEKQEIQEDIRGEWLMSDKVDFAKYLA